ncbi:vitamin K epoxide reductase family protein [archaeon]|jgi:uncharacterized membrane protein|nr:vitamin K epoxide reductase family protein [archaeon]MBT3450398.1 vitamin K epoxide reductase family protein [archaeon]MBT6868624.1 vitamin K epoxide reductase family protein [archaeon]MBT7193409.1 vitamin K epoxide reductase family protein [archaeon]MBT7381421.1 vitamin K epoxide reductase family protein [archaeon]
MKNKTILIILIILSILGLLTSLYLTNLHFNKVDSICDFNQKFSCTDVSRSAYAKIFGVPVAMLGVIAYLGYLFVPAMLLKKFNFKRIHSSLSELLITKYYFLFALFGLFFSLYLTYLELATIHVICPLCLVSQTLVIMILFYGYLYFDRIKRANINKD